MVLGQSILNFASKPLQWVAVIWLLCGIILVRRSSCIPLLLLSYPAFMCEIQRDWAWAQVLTALLFFVRVITESRFSGKQLTGLALFGLVVVITSWPYNTGELLSELRHYSGRDLLLQWFHPRATWAIYPLRTAFDRTLFWMLLYALILSGKYFSTHRVWHAYMIAGVMMLSAAYGAALLPWQKPHLFLGTTNHASHEEYLFHGAGYNPYFFTMPMVSILPMFLIPIAKRRDGFFPTLIILAFPIVYASQRAIGLGMMAIFIASCVYAFLSVRSCEQRLASYRRLGRLIPRKSAVLLLHLFSSAILVAWLYSVSAFDAGSLGKAIRSMALFKTLWQNTKPAVVENPASRIKYKDSGSASAQQTHPVTDGRDLWYGNKEIPQGIVTFDDSDFWKNLPGGSIITISDRSDLRLADGSPISTGHKNGPWIHINVGSPLSLTPSPTFADHNLQDRRTNHFVVYPSDYHIRLIRRDGSIVQGPFNVYMSIDECLRLESQPQGFIAQNNYEDVRLSSFGLPNSWGEPRQTQSWSSSKMNAHEVVINEINAGEGKPIKGVAMRDSQLVPSPDNGGNWVELYVNVDGADLRGWQLQWARATYHRPDDTFSDKALSVLKTIDKARSHMLVFGLDTISDHWFAGMGAGTFARHFKQQSEFKSWVRDARGNIVFRKLGAPHMHNTYLDLMVEHGALAMIIAYISALIGLFRIIREGNNPSRIWLFPIAATGAMSLVQNYFYQFTTQLYLLPLILVLMVGFLKTIKRALSNSSILQ